MSLSTYQITDVQTSEDCNLNTRCNQIASKLHLLLHYNNRYFLISTVSLKIVSLGPYTEIAPHSQHSIRCTVRNSASVSHRFSCIMVISSNLLPLNNIFGFGKIKKESSTKILYVGQVLNDSYLHSQKFKHQQSRVSKCIVTVQKPIA